MLSLVARLKRPTRAWLRFGSSQVRHAARGPLRIAGDPARGSVTGGSRRQDRHAGHRPRRFAVAACAARCDSSRRPSRYLGICHRLTHRVSIQAPRTATATKMAGSLRRASRWGGGEPPLIEARLSPGRPALTRRPIGPHRASLSLTAHVAQGRLPSSRTGRPPRCTLGQHVDRPERRPGLRTEGRTPQWRAPRKWGLRPPSRGWPRPRLGLGRP